MTALDLDLGADRHSIVLVGDYGSGKTEVAVNLALSLAREETVRPVAIADLDLVNPYFRCREAREPLEAGGIRVVMPAAGHQFADLPILLPQVKGLLGDANTLSVLDVGGDEVGSRVLAGLAPSFSPARHAFWFVVNARRPFCDTPEGCLAAIRRIEGASGWRVNGLVANTHLMEETTAEIVLEGLAIGRTVAATLGVEVTFVAVMKEIAQEIAQEELPCPLLSMERIMVPPWIRRPGTDVAANRLGAG